MVKRDLALLLDKSKNYNEIYSVSQKTIKEKLKDVQLFDVYEGKNIPEGKKSYGVRFTFYNKEKTLTDQEIEKYMDQVMTALTDQLGAEIRKN
jgi:phenylalanyl-tRNA synthetase beta chain